MTGVLVALTSILAPVVDDQRLPVALAYLLVALVAAAIWGWVIGIGAALAANLLFNFFFVEPLHRLSVQEPEDMVALAMFLAVAAIGAAMLSLLRRQLALARAARAESDILLSVSREVAAGVSARDSLDRLCTAMARALGANGCSIVKSGASWEVAASSGGLSTLSREEENLAARALKSCDTVRYYRNATRGEKRIAREATEGSVWFMPVVAGPGAPCVLRIAGRLQAPAGSSRERLLAAFRDEVSVALHRAALQEESRHLVDLKRADDMKSALLSSVSHDLRTPLTAIKAAVQTLRDPEVDWSTEDRQASLETIETQTDRLTATVTGLLEMSRLESGSVQPKLEIIQAAPALEEVVQATHPATTGRSVSIDCAESIWLRADYRLLLQALSNLVENAARHSVRGGGIHLGASEASQRVRVWVEDEGPGIAPQYLPQIFDKFYRVPGQSDQPGTGLGLSIVKAMVDLSGGSVHAETVCGRSRFVIELPSAPAPR